MALQAILLRVCSKRFLINNTRSALFPASYIEPIIGDDKLQSLKEEGKFDSLRLVPVKCTLATDSVSVLYDRQIAYFTNLVMKWGERHVAKRVVEEAFSIVKKIQLKKYHAASEEDKPHIELNVRTIFATAVQNCKPALQLTPIKKGGITYQVPTPVTTKRSQFMAMKWLIAAGDEKEMTTGFSLQLAREILDAFHHEGRVIRRKQDLHRICETNKAYAHYRWS